MKQIALSFFVIAASGAYVWQQANKNPANDLPGSPLSANATELLAVEPMQADGRSKSAIKSDRVESLEPLARVKSSSDNEGGQFSHDRQAGTATVHPAKFERATPILATLVRSTLAPAAEVPAPASSFDVTPAVYAPIPQPRPAYPQSQGFVVRAGMTRVGAAYVDGTYTGPASDAYYGIVQLRVLVQNGRLTAMKLLSYPSDRRTSIRINRRALPLLRDEAISAQNANVDIVSGATLTSRAFIHSLRGALRKASS